MNKQEFKAEWESDEHGGGITFNDVASCYVKWGIGSDPHTKPMAHVRFAVLKAAKTIDAEEYAPVTSTSVT